MQGSDQREFARLTLLGQPVPLGEAVRHKIINRAAEASGHTEAEISKGDY